MPATAPQGLPSSSGRTRVRFGVLGFTCTLAMILYLDRVSIGVAGKHLLGALGQTGDGALKWAFSCYALAYALFEVPGGFLADRFGPRKTLLRIVLWWSFFTALIGVTGLSLGGVALGVVFLAVMQFLAGMGSAGAFPNITRSLHNWFPIQERGLTQGAVWMCGRLTGGLTPFFWMLLVSGVDQVGIPPLLNWRTMFYLLGGVGALWCVFFALHFRDRPEQHPKVNQAERQWIRSSPEETGEAHAHLPWGKLMSSRNLWLLCLMYACQAYGWYFHITYLPGYLSGQFQLRDADMMAALYKGGPLLLGAFGCLLGGFLTDGYVRRTGNRRWGRRLFGILGHGSSAVCFLLAPFTTTAFWAFLVLSFSAFFCDITMASAWAACQDIGRRHAAVAAGFMNMMGNLGGAIASWVTGTILDAYVHRHAGLLGQAVDTLSAAQIAAGQAPGYRLCFFLSVATSLVGVACWSLIDASRPAVPEQFE